MLILNKSIIENRGITRWWLGVPFAPDCQVFNSLVLSLHVHVVFSPACAGVYSRVSQIFLLPYQHWRVKQKGKTIKIINPSILMNHEHQSYH